MLERVTRRPRRTSGIQYGFTSMKFSRTTFLTALMVGRNPHVLTAVVWVQIKCVSYLFIHIYIMTLPLLGRWSKVYAGIENEHLTSFIGNPLAKDKNSLTPSDGFSDPRRMLINTAYGLKINGQQARKWRVCWRKRSSRYVPNLKWNGHQEAGNSTICKQSSQNC